MRKPSLVALLLPFLAVPAFHAQTLGEYFPLEPGFSWTYTDPSTSDTLGFADVFGPYPFGGFPNAVLWGPNEDYAAIYENDGTTFRFLGGVEDGDPIALPVQSSVAGFSDGDVIPVFDNDFIVIREWSQLNSGTTAQQLGIPPGELTSETIVWVWYDGNIDPSQHAGSLATNALLGFGDAIQTGGSATDVDVFNPGVGPIYNVGVEANDGTIQAPIKSTISFDCNDNAVADHTDIHFSQSVDANLDGIPDECQSKALPFGCLNAPASLTVLAGTPQIGTILTVAVDNPFGTQAPGSLPVLLIGFAPDPAYPCGSPLPGFGMAGAGTLGELLIGLAPTPIDILGAPWTGAPAPIAVPIPNQPSFGGLTFYAQAVLVDPMPSAAIEIGLTAGLELVIGVL